MVAPFKRTLSECVPGEEWLVRKVGAYLPGAHEEVVDIVNAFILTDKVTSTFTGAAWIH